MNHSFQDVEWQHSANKGEWSELYALYKLLVDQQLYPIAKKQHISANLRMPILSILRHTDEELSSEYRIDDEGCINIKPKGCEVIKKEKAEFEKHSTLLLDAIKRGAEKAAFDIAPLDVFRKETYCPKIKCFAKTLAPPFTLVGGRKNYERCRKQNSDNP